ncbi:MAG: stage III sporulation protein AD [Lachnospiraceae bacterium]|nr:stage III sporulation protein AD [Lachnospiraceae bacterium]
MAEIVKVGALGILGVLLAVQFKAQKPEYGIYISFALSILIFCYVLRQVEAVMAQLTLVKQYLGGGEKYLSVLLKVVGITYICEFCAGICKDGGFGAVADQIEILGKLSVMFAGLPILFAVIEQIKMFTM